ncbi:MAG TPA: APC family permease [Actinomycetes bacterium]|nr:APC family permease [Actinomycetes bacterium]
MEAPHTTMSAGGFYTRQATGLVREIGTSSNVALNISFISLPLAALVATQAPFAFPGANIILVVVIAAVLAIVPALLYGWLGTAMPRSGGDYVFVSRIMGPLLGFAANFNITAWYVLVMANFALLLAPFGLSAALATTGVATDSRSLVDWSTTVTGKGWQFGTGAAVLVVTALMMSLRPRAWIRIFMVLFLLSLVGVVIAAVLMVIHGRADFQASLTRFGTTYDGVIQTARQAGYQGGGTFSLRNTITAANLAFASFGYAIVTTYAGGEIRSPRRTLLRALLLSLAVSTVIAVIMMALAARTVGQDFMGSLTYLSNHAPDRYPLSAPPFYFLFAAMLTNSSLLIVVMALSFALAFFVGLPTTFLIATRSLFAWSFDRILPQRLSEVNDRTHSPLVANAVVLVVSMALLAVIVYGPSQFLDLLFTAGAAETLTFLMVALAAIVFPWRRRQLYQESPIARRLLGLPAIAVIGFLAIGVYLLFMIPLLVNDDLDANAMPGIVAMAVIALAPFLIYGASYLWNRRRGVDLGLAFTELPPE